MLIRFLLFYRICFGCLILKFLDICVGLSNSYKFFFTRRKFTKNYFSIKRIKKKIVEFFHFVFFIEVI